eukprot:COSAG02_NODE_606_length_19624_cov_33.479846_23_plen_116_part_00
MSLLYMAARCEVCQNDNFERDPGRAAADEMGVCLTCKGSVVKHLRPLITKDNLLTITAHDLRITLKEKCIDHPFKKNQFVRLCQATLCIVLVHVLYLGTKCSTCTLVLYGVCTYR